MRLAAGGNRTRSHIHMACTDGRGRMVYLRYSPRRGIVERKRLPGPRLYTIWQNVGFNGPALAISYSRGYTYVAWATPNEKIALASRRGKGRWKLRRLASSPAPYPVTPFQIAMASDGRKAYVAWTNPRGLCIDNGLDQCVPDNVRVATVTSKRVRFTNITTGPTPCPYTPPPSDRGFNPRDPATSDPSIVVTKDGPVIAVVDTCEGEARAKIKVRSMKSGVVKDLPAPPIRDADIIFNPLLFETSGGLFLTYKTPHPSTPPIYWGYRGDGDLLFSQYDQGQWTEPLTMKTSVNRGAGAVARARGRVFVAYDKVPGTRGTWGSDQALAEWTSAGWQRKNLPTSYEVGDLVAAGRYLYFDAGYPPRLGQARLGRAELR